ncbi:MAG: sel1 repeat family protein [Ramlibacter sp.]|nr:sel1 repeat family protein [Ramlibacter sp.]
MDKLGRAAAVCALLMAVLSAQAGYDEGMNALATRDFPRARAEFETEPDNPKALYQLSRMARFGQGEAPDEARAARLLARAASLGHLEARLDHVFVLGNGRGVPKDPAGAIQLLETLAAEGQAEAEVNLGRVFRFGWWDQAKDDARATRHFEKAMRGGDDNGRALYAQALIEGLGVPRDEARGAQLLQEAADRGHIESQLEYGRILTAGLGVAKDEAAGAEWYRKAAERADRVGQYRLGLVYLRGRGLPRDEALGARWIDASARQGWVWGQLQMGDLFRLGQGVPRMRSEAYFWYTVAARGTAPAAVEAANAQRTALARELTESEITRAVRRAEAFRPQAGFQPRVNPLPPVTRNDRMAIGQVSLTVPVARGYINSWELTEFMQRAYPNDPDMRPLLMTMNHQEDMNRMKLGLPGGIRSIEVARHVPDDAMVVSATLFAGIKDQLRAQIQTNIANGRYRSEGTLRDDERVFSMVRASVTDPNRVDAIALVLVKERVLAVSFTGFTPEQKSEITALVKAVTDDILSANRSSFFSQ